VPSHADSIAEFTWEINDHSGSKTLASSGINVFSDRIGPVRRVSEVDAGA